MLLNLQERNQLLKVLGDTMNISSQREHAYVYDYMVPSLNSLMAIMKGVSIALDTIPGAQGRKIANALKAIHRKLLMLYRDISHKSSELCNLLSETVKVGSTSQQTEEFKRVFARHLDYIVSRLPLDPLLLDIGEIYTLIITDPADVLSLCNVNNELCAKATKSVDILLKALEESDITYTAMREYLLRLTLTGSPGLCLGSSTRSASTT